MLQTYVWTLIDILLLGLVVVQFTDAGYEPVIEGLGFRFAIIGVLNAVFVWLNHHNHYIVGCGFPFPCPLGFWGCRDTPRSSPVDAGSDHRARRPSVNLPGPVY